MKKEKELEPDIQLDENVKVGYIGRYMAVFQPPKIRDNGTTYVSVTVYSSNGYDGTTFYSMPTLEEAIAYFKQVAKEKEKRHKEIVRFNDLVEKGQKSIAALKRM